MYDGSMDDALNEVTSMVINNEIFVDARIMPTINYGLILVLEDSVNKGFISLANAHIFSALLESMTNVYEALLVKHSLEMIPDYVPENLEKGENNA